MTMARSEYKLVEPTLSFHDRSVPETDFASQVKAGLRRHPKQLAPKFFYDKRGSELFDAICDLPEYYLTRADIEVLDSYADEIAARLGNAVQLIEFGSGSSLKIQLLLDAVRPEVYMPIDISGDHLLASCKDLAARFEWLSIHAVCADYSKLDILPYRDDDLRMVAFFPGSSIGNFEPVEALRFLGNVRRMLGPGGALIVGVDLKKDPDVLEAAYNDRQGVTAAFNINLLHRLVNELQADLDITAFNHRAFYDPNRGRIEMHLVSTQAQDIRLDNELFHLRAGESIHTESSYKYSTQDFHALGSRAGFTVGQVWTDRAGLFSVHYLEVA